MTHPWGTVKSTPRHVKRPETRRTRHLHTYTDRPEALLFGSGSKRGLPRSTSWWMNVRREDWGTVSSQHSDRLSKSREGNRRSALE
jgi:hypothetical protein